MTMNIVMCGEGMRGGAVDVVPSAPVFPDSFYAGIESTHVRKGYSRYGSEAYSHKCDAVSFAFYNSDVGFKRVIGDYKNQQVWHVTSPNSTFPNGACWSEPMSNRPEFIEGENEGLVSSSKFLGFINANDNEATYVPGGANKIRCVDRHAQHVSVLLCRISPELGLAPGHCRERSSELCCALLLICTCHVGRVYGYCPGTAASETATYAFAP